MVCRYKLAFRRSAFKGWRNVRGADMWAEDDLGPNAPPCLDSYIAPAEGNVYRMYHGTSREAAEKIKVSGFKRSSKGMLGPGVYLSRDLEKASRYPLDLPVDQRVVLRVMVNVGKVIKIDRQYHPLQTTWHEYGYDTAWCPPKCGMVRSGLEEDCVWDPNRITVIDEIRPKQGCGVWYECYYRQDVLCKMWKGRLITCTTQRLQRDDSLLPCIVVVCSVLLNEHESYIHCLGRAHSEAALMETDCPHCEGMSLRMLHARITLVLRDDPASYAFPPASSLLDQEGPHEESMEHLPWTHPERYAIYKSAFRRSAFRVNIRGANMWAEYDFGIATTSVLQSYCEPAGDQIYKMYHGTSKQAAKKILSEGFRQSSDGMLGCGVYLSRDLEKASRYPLHLPIHERVVLRVKVNVGKVIKIGYQGHPLQKTWHSHGYDTAWCPPRCGSVASLFEEDCVWDPKQIIVIDEIEPCLQSSIEPAGDQVYRMYHGTSKEAAAKIKKEGFRQSPDGMLGRGVYLSRDLEKASRYPLDLPVDQRVVLRVKVNVGKVIKIDYQCHPLQKTWHEYGYDTAWCPPKCGMTESGCEEDCVWDPNRIAVIDAIRPF
ncbi:uncharacterized protein LOC127430523 [Myxocyprinus asiaticus]|uniref:uncharacterized protein LOC127430523 n=1 Tax=Myxocyprinus asiaticus TaxID=70543 RepID=UPI002221A428|nr:uncharacterized protein LOC127430523 [Myxocyprinus asiaticus]